MDAHDPLTIIAESYRLSAHAQLLSARTQAFALALLGLALLVLGCTVWQHVVLHNDSRAMQHALMTQTQVIAAQTLLLDRLNQH